MLKISTPMDVVGIVTLVATVAGGASADTEAHNLQVAEKLQFEVVSVKPVASGRVPLVVGATCLFATGVRLRCPAITVQQLITRAFYIGDVAVPRSQIVGGPDWIETSQFEIEAVLNAPTTPQVLQERGPALLRRVLEERFHLESHLDRRLVQVYTLVTASAGGKLGPRLSEALTECPPLPAAIASTRPNVAPPTDKACWGGIFQAGHIGAGALSMRELAAALTNQGFVDRIVVDRTGLMGKYELELRWSPTSQTVMDRSTSSPTPLDHPTLFTALQEQLGLKLEPRSELMDVLVIDHVEAPTPN
jgi:uncharacterized protein (TIGR03435 family)